MKITNMSLQTSNKTFIKKKKINHFLGLLPNLKWLWAAVFCSLASLPIADMVLCWYWMDAVCAFFLLHSSIETRFLFKLKINKKLCFKEEEQDR